MISVNLHDVQDIINLVEQDVEVRTGYLGPGMKEPCLAIVANLPGYTRFIVEAAGAVIEAQEAGDDDHPLAEFLLRVENVQDDSLGMGHVWYWPGVTITE